MEQPIYLSRRALKILQWNRISQGQYCILTPYYLNLGKIEAWWSYFQGAIYYGEKAFLSALGNWHMVLAQFDESLMYFEKNVERLKEIGALDIDDMQRIGTILFTELLFIFCSCWCICF